MADDTTGTNLDPLEALIGNIYSWEAWATTVGPVNAVGGWASRIGLCWTPSPATSVATKEEFVSNVTFGDIASCSDVVGETIEVSSSFMAVRTFLPELGIMNPFW